MAEVPDKQEKKVKPTKPVACNCDCPMQDTMYGRGVRIANRTSKGTWRCTGCGTAK